MSVESSKKGASERLRPLMDAENMTIQAFRAFWGVPKGTFAKDMNSDRASGAEALSALRAEMGMSANGVLDGFGPRRPDPSSSPDEVQTGDGIPIPRASIQAAPGGAVPAVEALQGRHPFGRDDLARRGLNPKRLSVIIGKGDGMIPDIHGGHPVLIAHDDTTPRDGNIHALRMGDDLSIQRAMRLPDGLQLIRSHKVYPPIALTATRLDRAAIMARVVASSPDW